jgi:hypothetical protein
MAEVHFYHLNNAQVTRHLFTAVKVKTTPAQKFYTFSDYGTVIMLYTYIKRS